MNINLQKHQKGSLSATIDYVINEQKNIDLVNDAELKAARNAYAKHLVVEHNYSLEKAEKMALDQQEESMRQLFFLNDLFKEKDSGEFTLPNEKVYSLLSVIDVLIDACIEEMTQTTIMVKGLPVNLDENTLIKINLPKLVVCSLKNYIGYIIEKSKTHSEEEFQRDYINVMSKTTNYPMDVIVERAKTMKKKGDAVSIECFSSFEKSELEPAQFCDFLFSVPKIAMSVSTMKAIAFDFSELKTMIIKKHKIATDKNIN